MVFLTFEAVTFGIFGFLVISNAFTYFYLRLKPMYLSLGPSS